jgi:hypothetical protein
MLYFRSEFFTRVESLELLPIPAKVHNIEQELLPLKSSPARLDIIERDMEPFRPLPIRVQLLEQKQSAHVSVTSKQDAQIDMLVSAINSLATQQAVAISKIDDLRKQNERMENKIDSAARNAGNE